MAVTLRGTQPPYQDSLFYPQPGDLVLCHRPTIYTDGTAGPLIQIYKDNFHFQYDRDARTSFRKPHTETPDFKRGDKVLRLFKVYRTWEFVPSDTHRLHIYYPGFASNWHWFTATTASSKDHLKAVKTYQKSNVSHVRPSKIFNPLSEDVFQPTPGDIVIRVMEFDTIDWMTIKCLWCKEEETRKVLKQRERTPPPECLYCYEAKKEARQAEALSWARTIPFHIFNAFKAQLKTGDVDLLTMKCIWCHQQEESRQGDDGQNSQDSGSSCGYCDQVRFQVEEAGKTMERLERTVKCLVCQKEEDEKKMEKKRERDLYWQGSCQFCSDKRRDSENMLRRQDPEMEREDMDLEDLKCKYCMKKEKEGEESNGWQKRRSQLYGKDCTHDDKGPDPEPEPPGCVNCTVERMSLKESLRSINPWRAQYEIKYWTEKLQIQKGDLLVRYAMDTKYDEGTFKKTHLQAELFSFTADEEKPWKSLGMDVAHFGPMPLFKDIVYRPQPADIIISRCRKWGVEWNPFTNVGGFAMFYKDPNYFGDKCMGQNLFPPPKQTKSEFNEREETKMPIPLERVAPETHADSWLIRLGQFDEYWDFHVNDRAEIFLMHPNGKTMYKHFTVDYQHLAREPDHDFDKKGYQIKDVIKLEPNQWDLIVRKYEKTKESTMRNLEWERDPDFWMKDPQLWGKDTPPRYDKDVEIHNFWSGFVFEDQDLLVRPSFVLGDGVLPGLEMYIPNYSESDQDRLATPYGPQSAPRLPISTYANVEVYQVSVAGSDPPVFMLCGRDKFDFPTQEGYVEGEFEYAEGDGNLWDKPKDKPRRGGKEAVEERKGSKKGGEKGGEEDGMNESERSREGQRGEMGDGGERSGGGDHGTEVGEEETPRYDVWAEVEKEKEKRAEKRRNSKRGSILLKLTGGDYVALP